MLPAQPLADWEVIIATIGGFATGTSLGEQDGNGGVNGTVFASQATISKEGTGVWITGLLLGFVIRGIGFL
jgi:hypothetical protein